MNSYADAKNLRKNFVYTNKENNEVRRKYYRGSAVLMQKSS